MSIIKSFSVGDGDMFYIKHGSDNFTIIDCCMSDDDKSDIVQELKSESRSKGIIRFISTHPDDDHIRGLDYLDDEMNLLNFYCVKNKAIKDDETYDFDKYCELRDDSERAFYIYKGCSRRWMNLDNEERGSSGINILWPITSNKHFKEALEKAEKGESTNNISPIIKYSLNNGVTMLWMGDLEKDFMENIEDEIALPEVDILFAPHHGRSSGKVPKEWLGDMDPKIIIVGEAPSKDLDYYSGYNTITQNTAGDIIFECETNKVHIYVSNQNYTVSFLEDEDMDTYINYIGTLTL
jgi:beta-lactamase superfamily II metal-dependent hydrolase